MRYYHLYTEICCVHGHWDYVTAVLSNWSHTLSTGLRRHNSCCYLESPVRGGNLEDFDRVHGCYDLVTCCHPGLNLQTELLFGKAGPCQWQDKNVLKKGKKLNQKSIWFSCFQRIWFGTFPIPYLFTRRPIHNLKHLSQAISAVNRGWGWDSRQKESPSGQNKITSGQSRKTHEVGNVLYHWKIQSSKLESTTFPRNGCLLRCPFPGQFW